MNICLTWPKTLESGATLGTLIYEGIKLRKKGRPPPRDPSYTYAYEPSEIFCRVAADPQRKLNKFTEVVMLHTCTDMRQFRTGPNTECHD